MKLLRRNRQAPEQNQETPEQGVSSRRAFLKGLFVGGGAVGVAGAAGIEMISPVSLLGTAADILYREDEYGAEVTAKATALEERYGISLGWKKDQEFRLDRPYMNSTSLEAKVQLLDNLKKVFALYPPELIQRLNIYFRVGRFVKGQGLPGAGLYLDGNAAAFIELDMDGNERIQSEINIAADVDEEVVHHEVAHLIDELVGWERSNKFNSRQGEKINDSEWIALNPNGVEDYHMKDFTFLDLLNYYRARFFGDDPRFPEGFAQKYGRKNVNEDQATVMEGLINLPSMLSESPNDPILEAKMKKAKEYFFIASNGRMNEQYWKDLALGKVNEAYWTI